MYIEIGHLKMLWVDLSQNIYSLSYNFTILIYCSTTLLGKFMFCGSWQHRNDTVLWLEGSYFFSCFIFFLTSYLYCRSCLVNHTDLERLFCSEDFLTWGHGLLIWFVLTSYAWNACCFFSLVFNLWHFIVVGPVCWNISLCTQTASNKCNGVASNSCVYMDKNSLSG